MGCAGYDASLLFLTCSCIRGFSGHDDLKCIRSSLFLRSPSRHKLIHSPKQTRFRWLPRSDLKVASIRLTMSFPGTIALFQRLFRWSQGCQAVKQLGVGSCHMKSACGMRNNKDNDEEQHLGFRKTGWHWPRRLRGGWTVGGAGGVHTIQRIHRETQREDVVEMASGMMSR